MPPSNVCYSYSRFSSGQQADGDSIRRQNDLRESYLKRHPELKLDTSLKLTDAGVSSFRGRHRKDARTALAWFVARVDQGRVPKGATLLVESIDRLGREHPEDAVPFLLSLISRGIRIVTLAPECVYESGMDMGKMFMLLMEAFRGHGESARKSFLSRQSWVQMKKKARDEKKPLGKNLHPAWLTIEGGRLVAIPERAAAVASIFRMAAAGWSTPRITRHLNATGVPAFGRKGVWVRSYVQAMLTNRAVLGEYQPRLGTGRRAADGEPIEGYWPAVVSPALFEKSRAGMTGRLKGVRPRKPCRFAHPFQGLLTDALDDCGMYAITQKRRKYVVSMRGYDDPEGDTHRRPFPLSVLTSALLTRMRELRAADLFDDPSGGRVAEVTAKLAAAERRLAVAVERFEADPENTTWAGKVDEYDVARRRLVRELADVQAEAANPLPARWEEAVARMAEDDPARLRIALSGLVDDVRVLVVKRGVCRVAAVQVFFAGGATRSYLIHWKPPVNLPGRKRPEAWSPCTFAEAGIPAVDLRDRTVAADLDKLLATIDVRNLTPEAK